MEEFKPQSSENILKKVESTGKNLPGTSLEDSINRLKPPFEKVDYASNGSEDIKAGELDYRFSYSSVEDESNESLKIYIEHLNNNLGEIPDPAKETKNWRKLNNLVVTIDDKEFDILKIIPDDSNIFFCPNSAIDNGIAFKNSKDIAVLGDMASPMTFVILLHELGHIVDFKKMEELGVERMVDFHTDSDLAENLRKERTASAFALKAMRPYIKNENMRHDILNLLKFYALKSYNDHAKTELMSRGGIRSHMKDDWGDYEQMEEREEENRKQFDIWEKWKETEKYKEWKSMPEFKDVEEWDEIWKWWEWVEKTGYDYLKDFPEEENPFIENSPIREAYTLLGAKSPLELNSLYSAEDQRLMKSHEWDYKNPDLLTNKVKNVLESVEPEHLSEDEQEWRAEILWFWYHHAISTAIALYKDVDLAKEFAEKALEYQSEDHPNKITRLFYLLLNDNLAEAEEWAKTIRPDSVEVGTARDLINNYKSGGALNIVS